MYLEDKISASTWARSKEKQVCVRPNCSVAGVAPDSTIFSTVLMERSRSEPWAATWEINIAGLLQAHGKATEHLWTPEREEFLLCVLKQTACILLEYQDS